VFEQLLELEPSFAVTALVEEVRVASRPGLRLIPVGRRRRELFGSVTLPAKTTLAVVQGRLLEATDVVHIGLPFALGRTQSGVAALARRRGLPVVVGPVQSPQSWVSDDEIGSREQLIAAEPPARFGFGVGAERATAILSSFAGPTLAGWNRRLLSRAAAVVAVDDAAAGLVRAERVPDRRIYVIPHPLSVLPLSGYQPPQGPPVLLTAGVLIRRKAVDKVITALALLRSAGNEATLVVAGQGPEEARLRRLAGELGVADAVSFLGWLDKEALRDAMARATIYVTMSRSESFGLAVADAMASGLPVVSAANGGAKSLVADKETGWLVPIDDEHALAHHLGTLLANPDRTAAVGARAARWAQATLSPPEVAKQWLEVYRTAIAGHEARGHTAGTAPG
jgi:glycosyltransferase involved in cell wall biosynthesis